MNQENITVFINNILDNMPSDWTKLTTHRLDIYNEGEAKVEFLNQIENLFESNTSDKDTLKKALKELPTAFDYIRLGHPLSCLLEWVIAKSRNLNEENIISFSSQTMPILAILRKNLLTNTQTQILYKNSLPDCFDSQLLQSIYNYKFTVKKISSYEEISSFDGTSIVLTESNDTKDIKLTKEMDFLISFDPELGSIVHVNTADKKPYISEILHVRRRESIAMTPNDCLTMLSVLANRSTKENRITTSLEEEQESKACVLKSIKEITYTTTDASVGSCGLSVQYAIMMGLIHYSMKEYKNKAIKFVVPPNCYGGTNDQARRVAACNENVEIIDLPVDGGKDMVQSVEKVLDQIASMDAVAFIIAEIPTNPRVEVPNMEKLAQALSKTRKTQNSSNALPPVFILDQTFCPNINFLGEGQLLSSVKTISYVSGSKFPSGGLCTAGHCASNKEAEPLMSYIENHLSLCDNKATAFQIETLKNQIPSMNKRIEKAYKNTREFVNFINEILPTAKINFVSEELANDGFTPSVFSLDLPVKGENAQEEENYKRHLNLKLINLMINKIPHESKHCVSYGQLKGSYWTVPATSTQGTTKEGDKDYIVRVAISPELDLDLHQKVFAQFCLEENLLG